ncbi:hypothetical protein Taro_031771 [Colocasia esculenta]|uniref:Uncharacterized protein n=1 Tax=Colocasia esculenta TaxID=4460 RepID=A0A843VPR4_COLES|nr:hypothetical protein [Colocasia esculenta]
MLSSSCPPLILSFPFWDNMFEQSGSLKINLFI